jgi:hypothetical protein
MFDGLLSAIFKLGVGMKVEEKYGQGRALEDEEELSFGTKKKRVDG